MLFAVYAAVAVILLVITGMNSHRLNHSEWELPLTITFAIVWPLTCAALVLFAFVGVPYFIGVLLREWWSQDSDT